MRTAASAGAAPEGDTCRGPAVVAPRPLCAARGMLLHRAPASLVWRSHEDRGVRPDSQLVVGQRPRDAVARAVPRAGPARAPAGLLRARRPVLRGAPRSGGAAGRRAAPLR